MCVDGVALHTLPNALTLQAGSVVTCDRYNNMWRWLVDGREVAAIASRGGLTDPRPAISGKGLWRIIHYAFEM